MMVACTMFGRIRERVFYCQGNLTTEHSTQILARGIQSILDKYNTAERCIPCKGIQRENSKYSPSEGGIHKEQSA